MKNIHRLDNLFWEDKGSGVISSRLNTVIDPPKCMPRLNFARVETSGETSVSVRLPKFEEECTTIIVPDIFSGNRYKDHHEGEVIGDFLWHLYEYLKSCSDLYASNLFDLNSGAFPLETGSVDLYLRILAANIGVPIVTWSRFGDWVVVSDIELGYTAVSYCTPPSKEISSVLSTRIGELEFLRSEHKKRFGEVSSEIRDTIFDEMF